MNKKSLKSLLIICMCFTLFLTACGQKSEEKADTGKGKVETSEKVKEGKEGEQKTITDMEGRQVEIPNNIEKIATFGANGVLNAFVELMGEGAKISHDMSPNFTKNDKWKYQYKFAPQMKGAPVFEDGNREILIETVLENKPDIAFTMTKDAAEYLEKNGITVVCLSWSDVEDVKVAVNLMGEVLNKQDIAKDYIEYFDKTVARANEEIKNINGDKKKVVYGNITEFTQPHKIAEWWIDTAGGISVTDNDREENTFQYSLEDLLKWNPDVMLVTSKEQIEEIKSNDRLKEIEAVKKDEIYTVPTVAHVWGNRTVEQPLTIYWTMNKLYPEIMTDQMLEEEIKYFYSHFFLYDLSDEEIKEIIN